MIAVLGVKRVIMLGVLLLLNAALAAGVYTYLMPEKIVKERELRAVRGEVSTLRNDIDRMMVEFDQLEEQKAKFETLAASGFFKDQGRREAEKILNNIQETSGVSKAIASIKAGVIEDSEEAAKANHKILRSPIELRLEATDDINIFEYLFLVENYFPGHISIKDLRIERRADVSGTVLRAISTGTNPTLVDAKVQLLWRTMIPESSVIGGEEQQQQ